MAVVIHQAKGVLAVVVKIFLVYLVHLLVKMDILEAEAVEGHTEGIMTLLFGKHLAVLGVVAMVHAQMTGMTVTMHMNIA